MKKLITISACSAALLLSANVMALQWPWQKKKETAPAATQKQETAKKEVEKKEPVKKADITFPLYSAPDSHDVIKKLPVNTNLVVIFRKGDWVKVGDRQDGTTGWVNVKQYREAKNNFYRNFFHEKTETLYFHSEKDKDGKTSIVGYRNGKKLTPEETQKMFGHLQQQQREQWQEMQRINNMVNFPFMMMPGIVIIEHPVMENKENKEDKK